MCIHLIRQLSETMLHCPSKVIRTFLSSQMPQPPANTPATSPLQLQHYCYLLRPPAEPTPTAPSLSGADTAVACTIDSDHISGNGSANEVTDSSLGWVSDISWHPINRQPVPRQPIQAAELQWRPLPCPASSGHADDDQPPPPPPLQPPPAVE